MSRSILHLQLLGRPKITIEEAGQRHAIALEPKRLLLLSYLARPRPGSSHDRSTICVRFWPETTESAAHNSLRQSIHYLRDLLGERFFTGFGTPQMGLEAEFVECDASRFEAALEDGRLEPAMEIYRGEFLTGISAPDSAELDRWIEGERRRLRRSAAGAALALARAERDRGDREAALGWVRRGRELTRYDESLIRFELRLLAEMGDIPGAIRAYRDFRTLLREDLEETPSSGTWDILQEIRGEDADRRTKETLRSEVESLESDLQHSRIDRFHVQEFLDSLLSSIDAGIIVVDSDLTVIAWNRGSEELWGVRAEDAGGKSLREIGIGLPVEEIRREVLRCVRGESDHVERDLEATGRRGVPMDVRVRIMPFVGDRGSRDGALLLVAEIPD